MSKNDGKSDSTGTSGITDDCTTSKKAGTSASLFRQQSLDSISENTDLNAKIKITSPGVIAVVIGICVVALGFIIWASLYEIETFQQVLLVKNDQNQTECIMVTDFNNYSKICKYKKVYLGEKAFTLNINNDSKSYDYIQRKDGDDDPISRGIIEQELDYNNGDKYYKCTVDNLDLPTQSAKGYVVVKKDSPLSYIVNYDWTSDSKQ